MLSTPAPFPHPGAEAFLVPAGQPCRILQQRRDGRLLISLTEVSRTHPDIATCASGNRTVALEELAATKEAAALKQLGGSASKKADAALRKPRRKPSARAAEGDSAKGTRR